MSSNSSLQASNLFNVNGLVAAITGGGTGLGLTMARALAANGAAKVYIIGRRMDKLTAACASSSPPGVLVPLQGDVTSKSSLSQLANTIQSQSGYLNLLIANAGISGPTIFDLPPTASLLDFQAHAWKAPMEDFTEVYNVNCTAVYYTVLACLALLDEGNRRGNMGAGWRSHVVATSSIAGFNRNARAGFAYITSKAAVTHLIKVMSTFMVPYGIRFNALAPGFFPSDLAGPLLKDIKTSDKAMTEEGAFPRSFIPAERLGSEEDMAGSILYLASKAGSYLNGSVVLVDGGRISTQPATY